MSPGTSHSLSGSATPNIPLSEIVPSLPSFKLPPPLIDDRGCEFQRQGGPLSANALQASGYFRENDAVYEPLRSGQIRLLTIKRGYDSNPLLCQLDAIDLENSPSYEAVSYCWGGLDEKPESIMIGNRQSLKVTQHLGEGLRRLRFNNANRVVWIDAVCINQANIDEKNHQIPMMKDIYGRAHRTLIWVGNLTMTEENCQRIGRAQGDSKASELTLCHNSELETVVHGTAANLERTLKQYADDVRRNQSTDVWWKRLWCIQEYYLSSLRPVVYIGPHSINWVSHYDTAPANPSADHNKVQICRHFKQAPRLDQPTCLIPSIKHASTPQPLFPALLRWLLSLR